MRRDETSASPRRRCRHAARRARAGADDAAAAISVTGEATVSVPPDLAQIDGGVTSDAKTAREASEANNAAMGKVLLALKGAGIDEKDYPDLAAVAAAAICAQPHPGAVRRSPATAPAIA